MPKFTIEHKTSLGIEETYSKVKQLLLDEQESKKLDPKLACTFDDAKKTGSAKGSQFKADVQVINFESGSSVSVTVDLPLLLTPFKGKVEEVLKRKLTKVLG